MSQQHPIVAVTGMAGAGLSTVRHAFKAVFERLNIKPAIVHGDGFRRFTDRQFSALLDEARGSGRRISWFGPDCNHFPELEAFFRTYGESGSGVFREYAHNEVHGARLNVGAGEFTPWKPLPADSDLLFYEGQPGGVMASTWTRRQVDSRHFPPEIDRRVGQSGIDVAQHVDLLIGVVPGINLEWIQKIHRDCAKGYCSVEESVETILRRMDDYIHYIVPQFGLTDINIQRMPLVDTSNPFQARDVPAEQAPLRLRGDHEAHPRLAHDPGQHHDCARRGAEVGPGGDLRAAVAGHDGAALRLIRERSATGR